MTRQANLRYVAGVSWPRSGHHLLQRSLAQYFGSRFIYCDFYVCKLCCRSFPCQRAGVTFSKNHDFGLDLPVDLDLPYLIQTRAFLPALVSNFDFMVHFSVQGIEDSVSCFRKTAEAEADRYRAFMRKWVGAPAEHHLVISYEQLVGRPIVQLRKAVRLFAPSERVSWMRLIKIIRTAMGRKSGPGSRDVDTPNFGIRETRRVEAFRYFDPVFFEEVRLRAEEQG